MRVRVCVRLVVFGGAFVGLIEHFCCVVVCVFICLCVVAPVFFVVPICVRELLFCCVCGCLLA